MLPRPFPLSSLFSSSFRDGVVAAGAVVVEKEEEEARRSAAAAAAPPPAATVDDPSRGPSSSSPVPVDAAPETRVEIDGAKDWGLAPPSKRGGEREEG